MSRVRASCVGVVEENMRIVMVGAGALGGLVGAQLTEGGEDVILLDMDQGRADLLNSEGLCIAEEGKGERCVRVRVVTSVVGLSPPDLVCISVKSYQTENAVKRVAPIVGPNTFVLSMQNGIGNAEAIARLLGPKKVLSGIIYHSSQHTGPNRLRYRVGIKPILIAPFEGEVTPEILSIGETFKKAGLDTNILENIDHVIWQKLLHNAVVNPVSALTGLTCNGLLADPDMQMFMRELCMEMIAVMRARGIPIQDEEDPYRPVIGSQKALGENRPTMWQDLSRGLLTEIDAMNGAVVREAERLGLKAPLNWTLVRMIHSAERQHGCK
jgi:2-dehydropantoate 2-reductase